MSVQDALTTMLAQIVPVEEFMTVPLATAQENILAENVLSPLNMPPFDHSTPWTATLASVLPTGRMEK